MTEANRRKKDPETVRQSLLDCAAEIAFEEGIGAISIQKVSSMAGVTKGGLFHHFPSKKKLVDALYDFLMAKMDSEIDAFLKHDQGYGAFTRAYITAMLADFEKNSKPSTAVLSMIMDAEFCDGWSKWFKDRLERHTDTDSGPWLEMLRYAADGLWLAHVSGTQKDLNAAYKRLIAATRKESPI